MRHLLHILLTASMITSSIRAEESKKKPDLALSVTADYLALHVSGTTPANATTVSYRFSAEGDIPENAEWTAVNGIMPNQPFRIDIPLPKSRWSAVQVRAEKGNESLVSKTSKFRPDVFTLLTPERLAKLPPAEKEAWAAYMKKSAERAAHEFDVMAAECRQLAKPVSIAAPGDRKELEVDSDTEESWFASAEVQKLADSIISFQTPTGGWSKGLDYQQGTRQPGMHWTNNADNPWHYCGTIDNRSTTEQIKVLAGVYSATKREDARTAAMRGLEYLFEAQYPNGGWPQNYPLESGYHEAITLNDNAMVHVMEVLLTIVDGKPPFAFADKALKDRALAAYEKALACLAAAQVIIDGQPTVWCAQHDPLDLAPVHARTKEPPSLSGGESAELVRFLMRKAPITPATIKMIDTAMKWFAAHSIKDMRKVTTAAGKTDYVQDANSTEVYWARFYDLKTGKPIFPGSQDGINYPTFHEMAAKNKVAYDFVITKPRDLIDKEMARWKKRLDKAK